MSRTTYLSLAALALAGLSLAVLAADPGAPTTRPAPTAEETMRELEKKIEPNPLIEPTRRPAGHAPGVPSAPVNLDPAVIGSPPGAAVPKLRREGDFIVNRLGRLVRAPNGSQMLFVFEADAKNSPEAPLALLPCRMLQNMEELVRERGENIVFILSGQITTYHSANYILPTMMKPALDKGNLQR